MRCAAITTPQMVAIRVGMPSPRPTPRAMWLLVGELFESVELQEGAAVLLGVVVEEVDEVPQVDEPPSPAAITCAGVMAIPFVDSASQISSSMLAVVVRSPQPQVEYIAWAKVYIHAESVQRQVSVCCNS